MTEILPGVLSREQLRELILRTPPLVAEWADLDEQLQPNGFDLRLAEVHRYSGPGRIGISNAERELPGLVRLPPDPDGWLSLGQGCYHIVYAEVVSLPTGVMALARPRSSLNRSGVTIHTAVWDAGYSGRSTSLLHVVHPDGFRVRVGARVLQLVFFALARTAERGYAGIYQGENT